jgi:hypothetical protein
MQRLFQFFFVLFVSVKGHAQQVSCGQAIAQLQGYAAQINATYHTEYVEVIPNQRCPTSYYNPWGQLIMVHPQEIQNCRAYWYTSLNSWYGQQCTYINSWYAQILQGCSWGPTPTYEATPAPLRNATINENRPIDTQQIQQLVANVNEKKLVKLVIPSTAEGYKPN